MRFHYTYIHIFSMHVNIDKKIMLDAMEDQADELFYTERDFFGCESREPENVPF